MNKYHFVKKYIEDKLKNNEIKAGGKLPSIRSMSEKLTCSKATVIKAYDELEKEHLIYSVPQSGYYAVNNISNCDSEDITKPIDFSSAAPDSSILPYKDFQHCINTAIDKYKEDMFSYGSPCGLDTLIKTLSKQFNNYQIFSREENIFITTGTQQAINILSAMTFPNGKNNVLVEQPTYHGIIECLKINNIRTLGIERKFKSIDFNELERIFRNGNIKFFYTIPRFSNPIGLSYTKEEKRQILRLAEKYDVYIVEDDYLADLELDSKEDSMFSMDTSNRVIYIKSFSKILMPGLRVGAVIIPDILVNTFLNYKKWSDLSTTVLSQGALDIYIKSGMFDKHRRKMAELYSKRMRVLVETLHSISTQGITFNEPVCGLFAGIIVDKKIDSQKILHSLNEKGIVLQDCSKFFITEFDNSNLFSISVSRSDEDMIGTGIPIVVQEILKNRGDMGFRYHSNMEI